MSESTEGTTVNSRARQVAEADWKGPVFSEGLGFNQGFFASTSDLRDFCYDLGLPVPAVVEGCTERALRLDARTIIEHHVWDEHCEAVCEEAECSVPDLQAALDEWCSRLSCRTWDIANVVVSMAEATPTESTSGDVPGGRTEAV